MRGRAAEQLTAARGAGIVRKAINNHLFLGASIMPSFADTFARNQGALSDAEQRLLQEKRVAVIGCGGLGGYVVEELVRIGVGRLHLFDPDVFSPSNCNRQLNALQSTQGRNKAEAGAQRAVDIHPFSAVVAYPLDFRAGEEEALQVDAMVDCLDEVQARRDLSNLCNRRGVPLVHGAVSGWYGQVGVQLPGFDLIDRLYPQRAAAGPAPSVLSFTVAVIASLQVAETVKLLLGQSSSLHNSWMHIDLKEADFLRAE
jgi:molybdopterin/thiamine biosynthesis adenylyltransferase